MSTMPDGGDGDSSLALFELRGLRARMNMRAARSREVTPTNPRRLRGEAGEEIPTAIGVTDGDDVRDRRPGSLSRLAPARASPTPL